MASCRRCEMPRHVRAETGRDDRTPRSVLGSEEPFHDQACLRAGDTSSSVTFKFFRSPSIVRTISTRDLDPGRFVVGLEISLPCGFNLSLSIWRSPEIALEASRLGSFVFGAASVGVTVGRRVQRSNDEAV